jgi:MFS family permease
VLLLPLQISTIDPAKKFINLSIVSSVAVLLALIGNPLAGALSDRTTSRFGRRRPWILGGAIASVLALALMMSAHAIIMLSVGYAIFQLFSNCVLAALAAIIPDQIPETQRGTVSGLVGLATSVGSIFGAVVIGLIIKAPGPSYGLLIILLLAILIPFAVSLRENALPRAAVPSFRVGAFLRNFWVDPRKHPDFGWAWLTRFVPVFGYSLGTGYLFYYLQDAVHYERLFPGQTTEQGVSTLTIISTLSAIVFTVLGGILSDRLRRRKPFIVIAYCLVAGTLADRAKDLGIVNIANTLPQSLAPAVAVFIISASHSYFALYVTGAIILLLGILVVRPIKAVR